MGSQPTGAVRRGLASSSLGGIDQRQVTGQRCRVPLGRIPRRCCGAARVAGSAPSRITCGDDHPAVRADQSAISVAMVIGAMLDR